MPPEIFLPMIKITKKYLFLILLAVLPLLSGCGTMVATYYRVNGEKVYPYLGTSFDGGMIYTICHGMASDDDQHGRTLANFYSLGIPLLIVDIPVSVATDTVAFPYDAYFLFEPRGQLHAAVEEQSFEKVKALLEGGADPNTIFEGRTPLIIACGREDIKFVQILLMYRADVNKEGLYGNSPLSVACRWGHTTILKLLLKHKVSLASKNYDEALKGACGNGHLEIVRILLDSQPDAERYRHDPELFRTENIEIIRLLIERGADLNSSTVSGGTPLWSVIYPNKSLPETLMAVALLIKNGADVNMINDNETVLGKAMIYNSPDEVIDFLRSKGAKTAEELEAEKEKKEK